MIMRMLYRRVLRESCFEDPKQAAAALYDEPTTLAGCLWSVLTFPWFLFKKTILWAIKKVIKMLVFVLVIDECANLMSEAFHQGYLLSYILRQRELTPKNATDDKLELLRRHINQACSTIDTRPLRKALVHVFQESPALLKQSGKMLKASGKSLKEKLQSKTLPDELQDREGGVLHKLVERILDTLVNMPDYLATVESAYEQIAAGQGKS